jgi:hypothetical protein
MIFNQVKIMTQKVPSHTFGAFYQVPIKQIS